MTVAKRANQFSSAICVYPFLSLYIKRILLQKERPIFEEDKQVLQIPITHKAIVQKKTAKLIFMWEIQGLEKNLLFAFSASASIEPKPTCSNLGCCVIVFVCPCVHWGG